MRTIIHILRPLLQIIMALTRFAASAPAQEVRNQGVSVLTHPLEIRLLPSRQTAATSFKFTLVGSPGVYAILSSDNLDAWSEMAGVTNQLGSAVFTDVKTPLSSQKWECAARAGTSTRFSYGDDPDYTSLTYYAWYLDLSSIDLTVRRVGQKLPNPWGMYDVYGNVWEWCQDWYGALPGGVQTDPTGPASNPRGDKVMRGGAFDYPNSSCRSASRLFFPANPFRTDWNLDFRVVLVTGPQ